MSTLRHAAGKYRSFRIWQAENQPVMAVPETFAPLAQLEICCGPIGPTDGILDFSGQSHAVGCRCVDIIGREVVALLCDSA